MPLFKKKKAQQQSELERTIAFHQTCVTAAARVGSGTPQPEYVQLLAEVNTMFSTIHPGAASIEDYWRTFPKKNRSEADFLVQAFLSTDDGWEDHCAVAKGKIGKGVRDYMYDSGLNVRASWDHTLARSHQVLPNDVIESEILAAAHPQRTSRQLYDDGLIMLASGAWHKIASMAFVLPAMMTRIRTNASVERPFPAQLPSFDDLSSDQRTVIDIMCPALQGAEDATAGVPFEFEETSELGEAVITYCVIFQKTCEQFLHLKRAHDIPMGPDIPRLTPSTPGFDAFQAAYGLAQFLLAVLAGKGPPDEPRAI